MKNLILISFFLLFVTQSKAQRPEQLTTDLLEHTDRVFLNGYPANIALDQLNSSIEPCQVAEIHNEHPCLGWVVKSNKPNTLQVAYRIRVASSRKILKEGGADMWDSGRVESDNSIAVVYEGKELKPSTVYYWAVKIWNNHGDESEYSEAKSFITAKILDNKTSCYPLQKTDEYPILVVEQGKGTSFLDFGKAAFGQLKLTLTTSSLHDTVTIHLGEKSKNNRIERRPEATIRYTQYRLPLMQGTHTYTLKIRPDERNTRTDRGAILMPDYIGEVYPFRYCELENYSHNLKPTDVVRHSVHYPFNESASAFHSSDTILNKIWELCKYSIKATSFAGIYVDGDRERIPYEADALLNQLSHYSVDREFAMPRYSQEHLILHATWPTEWILQSVIMAWNDYLYTGNAASLQCYYKDLKAKALLELRETNGLISTRTGKQTPDLLKSIHYKGEKIDDIVDWPQRGVLGVSKDAAGEADGYVLTTYNTVVNAYHYQALRLLGQIAGVLGEKADEKKYLSEAQRVRKQINSFLLDRTVGYYKDGIDTEHHSLHANMFPMAFGIVPSKYQKLVSDFIRTRGMACSVYGSQFLLDAVYDMQEAEYGLSLLTSTSERSWYNMIRTGSTITTEAWDNKFKPNQDWNHAWGAAPANLIPRKLMGIEPLEPGFKKIRIKPQPATLKEASIQVPTIRGNVKVAFDNVPGERFAIDVEIPANTTAEVWLPRLAKRYKLQLDQVSQKGIVDGDFVKVVVGSGRHSIVINRVSSLKIDEDIYWVKDDVTMAEINEVVVASPNSEALATECQVELFATDAYKVEAGPILYDSALGENGGYRMKLLDKIE